MLIRKAMQRLFGLLCISLLTQYSNATTFANHSAPFHVTVNDRALTHDIAFRAVLPNATLVFTSGELIELNADKKTFLSGKKTISWKAPAQPGYYPLMIKNLADSHTIQLQVFVLQPLANVKNGRLNGYQIGTYPPALKNLDSYQPPNGFIEVTQNNQDVFISPHFTLGQFLCKQQSGYPKYVALKPRLLEKLEYLLELVNQKGIRADTLTVMSGYRTPYYNKVIGNVANSRHIYGGAADIYIDVAPQNGVMDDLNKDGKIDIQDAKYLYNLADSFIRLTGKKELTGGVGLYKSTASHGPFVHVDVRGTKARW